MFDKLTRRSDGSIGESFPVDTVYATNEARQSFVFLSFRSPCFRLWVYCFWSGFAYRLGHATCCDSSRWIISPHFQHAAVLSGVAWLEITIGVAIGKTARILFTEVITHEFNWWGIQNSVWPLPWQVQQARVGSTWMADPFRRASGWTPLPSSLSSYINGRPSGWSWKLTWAWMLGTMASVVRQIFIIFWLLRLSLVFKL